MTTWLNDTFTGVDGVKIDAHTGELGATWTPISGFGGTNKPEILSNYMVGKDASAYWLGSAVAPNDGEIVTIQLYKADPTGAGGALLRGSTSTNSCYQAFWSAADGTLAIYKLLNAAATYTQLASVILTMTGGANTLAFKSTGTGASVLLEIFINGSTTASLSFTDNSATRLNALGKGGVYFGGTATLFSGVLLNSVVGSDTAVASSSVLSVVTPVDGRIHQRAGTIGTITVTGTYTGTPTAIEARLVADGTNTALTGFDWSSKVATPTAGAFSFGFTSVPQGGWYNVQIRDSGTPTTVYPSGKVGVGALFASTGQSNAFNMLRIGAGAQTANTLFRVHGQIGNWLAPNAALSDGAIAFGNSLVAALGVPVGYLDLAADGSGLDSTTGSNCWLPVSGASYQYFTNLIAGLGGKIEGLFWTQGETDSNFGISQATYYADLGTLFAQMRSDLGQPTLPIVLPLLSRIPLAGYTTDARIEAIRNAQVQKCADANIYRIEREDIPTGGDNIHHTPAGFVTLGQRLANAFKFVAGLATYYRGPRIASVTRVSASVFDVNLTHVGGSDFTPTSGLTGFRVLDGVTPVTISTAVRQSATKVRITTATAPTALPSVQYLYGITPDVTGIVKDNTALALPLEFNDGVTAIAAAATSAALTLKNRAGAVLTGLSGIKWAFFDQATPDLLTTPVVKGSTATTDGFGVMSLAITGSVLAPGATGFVTALSSDGTLSLAQPVVVA